MKKIVSKGYTLKVVSECPDDDDERFKKVLEGITEEDVKFLFPVCNLFNNCYYDYELHKWQGAFNPYAQGQFGHLPLSPSYDDEVEEVWKNLIEKISTIRCPEDVRKKWLPSGTKEGVISLLGRLGLEGYTATQRLISAEVFFYPEDIWVNNVTSQFR